MIEGLTPEVQALVDSGRLHLFDGEWICKLPPEKQMAAAKKMMHGTRLDMLHESRVDKSSTISHPRRGTTRSS